MVFDEPAESTGATQKEAMMAVSPQVVLFVLFMLAVIQATRIDEARQKRHHKAAKDSGE